MAEGASGKRALARYRLTLMVPAIVWIGLELARAPVELQPSMLQWVLLLAVVELVATEGWGGPGLSVAFGVQVTVAMLYDPVAAGLIAFAGAFDPREPRGQMRPLHDLSHRCLALSVVAIGSGSFHVLADGMDDRLARLLPAYAVATTLMYFAFLGADLFDRMLESGRPARDLLHEMDRISPYRFPTTFPGLGWFSLPAARLEQTEGLWPVVLIFGLTAYGRWVCIKAWTLKARIHERNELLDAQARELAVHLYRERRTVAELEELSRLKSQLVAMASHELRTPLTSIIGYAGALGRMRGRVEPGRRQEFLDIIERQAKRLLSLVERLLSASRLESGKFVTTFSGVCVRDLCHEVVEGLGIDGDRVVVKLPDDLPEPVTDHRFLAQVLGNLVENALKYSPRDRPCTLSARHDGDRLVLWVQDHGIGIPESERRRIFDVFYQVDRGGTRHAGGVGLGLTLVRELVDVLGGTISVESGVGRGSRFTVTLPLVHPAAEGTRRTTNGSRTNGSDTSIRPIDDPSMSPIRRRPSNF
ncbi:MAG TPA: HAMP domain-containing sensor histidine kinase [Actinomycetota bacterium]|nr:HAMP domain-containing sensor histidine kinase [Actinomycetota bacterium]